MVDDEPENLDVLATLLEDEYEVVRATDGPSALKAALEGGEFAAIISDQRMPGMTGIELLSTLAELRPNIVRMMLTAYSDLAPLVAAVNEGSVYRFLLKPWTPEEMRAAVADAIWLFDARTALQRVIPILSERKGQLERALTELERTQAQLLASERLSTVGRFSAGIAHNIRNNLTVMMNVLDEVGRDRSDPGLVEEAEKALFTLESLLRLVGDVSSLARARAQGITRTGTEIKPFLDRVIADLGTLPKTRERKILLSRDPTTVQLHLDPNSTRRALIAMVRCVALATVQEQAIEIIVHPVVDGNACFEVVSPPLGVADSAADAPRHPAAPPLAFAEIELGLELCRVVADGHGGHVVVRPRPQRRESAVQMWLAEATVPKRES